MEGSEVVNMQSLAGSLVGPRTVPGPWLSGVVKNNHCFTGGETEVPKQIGTCLRSRDELVAKPTLGPRSGFGVDGEEVQQ